MRVVNVANEVPSTSSVTCRETTSAEFLSGKPSSRNRGGVAGFTLCHNWFLTADTSSQEEPMSSSFVRVGGGLASAASGVLLLAGHILNLGGDLEYGTVLLGRAWCSLLT